MFLYSHWLGLPIQTRIKIAEQFGIEKTGPTHVHDNKIVSDGFPYKEVEAALSVEKIKSFLGLITGEVIETGVLWNMMVERIENPPASVPFAQEVIPPTQVNAQVVIKPEQLQANKPKRRGRPSTKKNPQDQGANPGGDGSAAKSTHEA